VSSIVKLDNSLVLNRLGWKPEGEESPRFPSYTHGYAGVWADIDLSAVPEEKLDMEVNKRVSLLLNCSIAPSADYSAYHALVAVNPKLLEVAEVSYAPMYLPGAPRVRPVIHVRGLKKFGLLDFVERVASIHLID
jgi:hypothetical protein